jgi:hypothetical protein
MSVLYRPVTKETGERYDIEAYTATDERDDIMKEMPASVVLGALVFFYRLGNVLATHTLRSLAKQQTTPTPGKLNSDKSGDGINPSMHLLLEMSSNLETLLNFPSTKL